MSEDIEMRRPREPYEIRETKEFKEAKERKPNREEQKQIREKVPIEKPSVHNIKNQKYVLVLLGILCLALISSIFIDNKPKKLQANVNQDISAARDLSYQDSSQTFIDRFNTEQQYRDSENQKNSLINQVRHQGLVEYNRNEKEPEDWKRKEQVRVLESRKSEFNFKNKLEINNREEQIKNAETRTKSISRIEQVKQEDSESELEPKQKLELKPKLSLDSIKKENKQLLLIPTGTIISGVLDQDINSDYIGQWLGHITYDVYDPDKEFILIPKGTKITGKTLHIGNVNAPIQNRMGMTVEWAILPDGKRIDFRKSDVEDQSGIHAIKDKINRHLIWQFSGVAAYAMLNSTEQNNIDNINNANNGFSSFEVRQSNSSFREQFKTGSKQQLNPIINKYLSLVPTVIIRAGMPIKILVKDDVYTKAWTRVNKTVYK